MARPQRIKVSPGDRFGRLTVIEELPHAKMYDRVQRIVSLECDCGNKVIKTLHSVRNEHTKTCGYKCPLRFPNGNGRKANHDL